MNPNYSTAPPQFPTHSPIDKPPVSTFKLIFWSALSVMYLTGIIFNLFHQTWASMKKYPFELTIMGAWFTVIQHALCHPHSPIPKLECSTPLFLLPLKERLQEVGQDVNHRCPRISACFKPLNYTAAIGFSNLTLNLEILIAAMYWALGAWVGQLKTDGTAGANSMILHGGFAGILSLDYLINQRPFYLRRALINTPFFLIGIFTPWNAVGQWINGEPIYPETDMRTQFTHILVALGISLASSIAIAAGIKLTSIGSQFLKSRCRPTENLTTPSINHHTALLHPAGLPKNSIDGEKKQEEQVEAFYP